MIIGDGIHSHMTAAHTDKTVCSHAHAYPVSEKFLLFSPWPLGSGWERKGGQRGCPKARREGADRSHVTLEVKNQEHRTRTGREKTVVGINMI